MGSPIIRVGPDADAALRVASTGSGLVDPIAMVASHYRLAEAVSRKRGHNPDAPANLRKVTETV
jgi:glucosamine--fructose-6-phosphate aminotransferase (isomerizing)